MAENVAEPSARRRRTRQQLLGAIRQHPGVTRGERAIDFGHSHVFVAVADTSGRVLADECQTADVDQHSTDALDAAADLLTRCLGAAGLTVSDLAGVAAGIPCPLDANTGVVRSPTILADWVDLHPAAELAARIGRPVHVDNDANMGARGEQHFGAARGCRDFIYVKASHGIGAGLVMGGQTYRGTLGIAGEIGTAGDPLLAGIRESIDRFAQPSAAHAVRIRSRRTRIESGAVRRHRRRAHSRRVGAMTPGSPRAGAGRAPTRGCAVL